MFLNLIAVHMVINKIPISNIISLHKPYTFIKKGSIKKLMPTPNKIINLFFISNPPPLTKKS